MYEDRIEIISPGTLYGTNRLDKLGTSTSMEVRNPNIVRILEEKGSVIENRHSGIPTMKREMRKYGLPDPEFYEERDSFKVIFRNNSCHQNSSDGGQQNSSDGGQQNSSDGGQQKSSTGGQQKSSTGGQQKGSGAGQQNMQNIKQNEQQSGQQKSSTGGQQNSSVGGQQNSSVGGQQKGSSAGQQNERNNLKLEQMKRAVLTCCTEPKTIKELQTLLKIKSRQYFSTNIIKALIDEGKLEYTNQNSIHARNQKYKTKNMGEKDL